MPSPPAHADSTWPRWFWLWCAAALGVWLVTLGTRALVSADEGRYAVLSLGMLQSGDLITPRLNGLIYFEKPPLQYWGGAVAMALLGVNEFAARLWPGLSGLATVALLAYTSARLWGTMAGVHATLVGASTTWIALNSHFLSLDAGLCAALTLTLCAVLLAQHAREQGRSMRPWVLAAWAGIAAAVLSKGLVGLVIPGAVLVLHSLWRWDFSMWRHLEWVRGPVLFLALTTPWFLAASARHPDFAQFFFIHEHLERYLKPGHRREGAPWYFVPHLLVGLMPWTGALPWLLSVRRSDFMLSWLWVWVVFIFVFFSISSSKLPSYILPIFPALVLLVVHRLQTVSVAALRRHLSVPLLFWALALASVPWLWQHTVSQTPTEAIRALAMGVGVGGMCFVAAAAAAWWMLRRQQATQALAVVALGHLVACLVVLQSHNTWGQLKSSQEMVAQLTTGNAAPIQPDTPVFAVQAYDQTLPFYLGRPVTLVDYRDEFTFGQNQEPTRWIPTLAEFAVQWNALPRAVAYTTDAGLAQWQALGLAHRVVWRDARRVVVTKP